MTITLQYPRNTIEDVINTFSTSNSSKRIH